MPYTSVCLQAAAAAVRQRSFALWRLNHAPLSGRLSIVEMYVDLFLNALSYQRFSIALGFVEKTMF